MRNRRGGDTGDGARPAKRPGAGHLPRAIGAGVLSGIAIGLFDYYVGIPTRSSLWAAHDLVTAVGLGVIFGGVVAWSIFRKGSK